MTYKKPLKAFMATTLMGFMANAMDTADGKRIGSYAIDALEAHETIETEGTGMKILVPFHAVKKAMYATMTADAERPDPYCGGGTDGKTVTITILKACGNAPLDPAEVATTLTVNKGEETPIPYNNSMIGGACTCGNYLLNWVVADGDATIRKGSRSIEYYITANEDASIYAFCQEAN